MKNIILILSICTLALTAKSDETPTDAIQAQRVDVKGVPTPTEKENQIHIMLWKERYLEERRKSQTQLLKTQEEIKTLKHTLAQKNASLEKLNKENQDILQAMNELMLEKEALKKTLKQSSKDNIELLKILDAPKKIEIEKEQFIPEKAYNKQIEAKYFIQ